MRSSVCGTIMHYENAAASIWLHDAPLGVMNNEVDVHNRHFDQFEASLMLMVGDLTAVSELALR